VTPEDLVKAERTYKELKNFIKSSDAHERAPDVLEYHFGEGDSRRNKLVQQQSIYFVKTGSHCFFLAPFTSLSV